MIKSTSLVVVFPGHTSMSSHLLQFQGIMGSCLDIVHILKHIYTLIYNKISISGLEKSLKIFRAWSYVYRSYSLYILDLKVINHLFLNIN